MDESMEAKMEIRHIPTLPDATQAREILERIRREFLPIAEARKWTVSHISEMCCCADGMDQRPVGARSSTPDRRGGRRRKRMSNNVWGYNMSGHAGHGVHRIHIRLRQPTDHALIIPYEDAARTMAHELAHCVHKNHSTAFYQLMKEIQEQHEDFVKRGLVLDRDGFPVDGEAHTLGGRGSGAARADGRGVDLRDAVRKAAQERAKRPRPMEPRRLGSTPQGAPGAINPSLPPREAARLAAERRLLDAQWCLPCDAVIELLSDDESDGGSESSDERDVIEVEPQKLSVGDQNADKSEFSSRKRAATSVVLPVSTSATKRTEIGEVSSDTEHLLPAINAARNNGAEEEDEDDRKPSAIDLTTSPSEHPLSPASPRFRAEQGGRMDDDDMQEQRAENCWNCTSCTFVNDTLALTCRACNEVRPTCGGALSHSDDADRIGWICSFCTLRNPYDSLACGVCNKTRWSNGSTAAAAANMKFERDEVIEAVKENEVRQSEEDFDGFNIYGSSKRKTATLPHLT